MRTHLCVQEVKNALHKRGIQTRGRTPSTVHLAVDTECKTHWIRGHFTHTEGIFSTILEELKRARIQAMKVIVNLAEHGITHAIENLGWSMMRTSRTATAGIVGASWRKRLT